MEFAKVYVGRRFLHRDTPHDDWFWWRKMGADVAVRSTPLGQDYGELVKFAANTVVRPDLG